MTLGVVVQDRGIRAATVALRNREFRIFWIAALISNTGGWMHSAAIPYVVFDLTQRNGGVGVAGFWAYIPMMVMGVVGGTLADRFDRKKMLVLTQLGQAVFAVGLWLVVSRGGPPRAVCPCSPGRAWPVA